MRNYVIFDSFSKPRHHACNGSVFTVKINGFFEHSDFYSENHPKSMVSMVVAAVMAAVMSMVMAAVVAAVVRFVNNASADDAGIHSLVKVKACKPIGPEAATFFGFALLQWWV